MTVSSIHSSAAIPVEDGARAITVQEGIVERVCRAMSELALVAMVVLIAAEIVARQFDYSFQMVDEVGGYLLSALTFLSLPVALVGGAFHQVDFFTARLRARGRAAANAVFLGLSLIFALIVEWQLWRLVSRSYASDVHAPTLLGTPIWIPQSFMVIGCGALIWSLGRLMLANLRAVTAPPRGGEG